VSGTIARVSQANVLPRPRSSRLSHGRPGAWRTCRNRATGRHYACLMCRTSWCHRVASRCRRPLCPRASGVWLSFQRYNLLVAAGCRASSAWPSTPTCRRIPSSGPPSATRSCGSCRLWLAVLLGLITALALNRPRLRAINLLRIGLLLPWSCPRWSPGTCGVCYSIHDWASSTTCSFASGWCTVRGLVRPGRNSARRSPGRRSVEELPVFHAAPAGRLAGRAGGVVRGRRS